MAVNKVITLTSGGTIVLALDGVNIFDASERERKLLSDISEAIRVYERQQRVETEIGKKLPGDG